jgi:hypothetical protein
LLTAALGGISLGEAGAQSSGAASVIVPVDPFRILDTRQGIGTGGVIAPVGADGTITLQVAGVGTVPAEATGIVLNITASEGTAPSFVTVWPTGTSRPEASVLNISPGLNLPNMITASLGSGGRVDLYNLAGNVHLIADVAAYLVPGGGGGQGPQGPQGLAGPQGPAGPPGPTAASFAHFFGNAIAIPETPIEITKLSNPMSGGAITTTFGARLVIDGAVSGYNTGVSRPVLQHQLPIASQRWGRRAGHASRRVRSDKPPRLLQHRAQRGGCSARRHLRRSHHMYRRRELRYDDSVCGHGGDQRCRRRPVARSTR